MKVRTICLIWICLTWATINKAQVIQQSLPKIDSMPDCPQPFGIIDFRQLAKDFDKKVYDFNATGDYWPLVWWDSSGKNFNQPVVGIYTAIGDARQGTNNRGMFHESLGSMGAILGASLVGIDKSKQTYNYVAMLKNYFNRETGWNIMMNNTCPEVALLGGGYGRDWWYDVYPNLLFYAIYDLYPNEKDFDWIARTIADQFYRADSVLKGNYNYTYFNYGTLQPHTTEICIQPDAAAGHAWVLYMAYKKFGDEKYLKGALSALKALQAVKENPNYEVLMPFGAYIAARINAEQHQQFDTRKFVEWSFDGTAVCREGWGALHGRWNGIDISGTFGSTVDRGGYAFLMNTYDAAWPLVPMVRYDVSYAKAIGKWMLNAANAAKLFYPQYMPKAFQALPHKAEVTKGVIAYEGIIRKSSYPEYADKPGPLAQGDGPLWVPDKNPDVSQFSVYGSSHVGIFGSIIRRTNVEGILELDLLATDFFRDKAYPSYLYYNSHSKAKKVQILNAGTHKIDLYDCVSGQFIARNIKGKKKISIPAKEAMVLVQVPSGASITKQNGKLYADGIVINYNASR
ncbi:hypothetical protein PIECOFPK_00102 [Mycovorax composti]|uniref:Uncharacterized protein n=1 Tax=Mycovorax composti TaxID=2962693 RepID=A0ABZ2EGL3_9BACT